ncbi:MAG: lysine 5,6-aminomutase subunit alpha, partial [Polyangiaceae bacterium]
MARVPLDEKKAAACRAIASDVATDVQRYIDTHTSVGAERTILRSYGVEGVDDEGAPLVNIAVDRVNKAGLLGRGISSLLASSLMSGATSVQDAAERIAYAPDLAGAAQAPDDNEVAKVMTGLAKAAIDRIDKARDEREARKARILPGETPHKYVIVATGNIYDDAVQAKAAAHAGADIVAVIRATAQSLLDYVPHGATTEGYGGTFATQENFRIVRSAVDEATEEYGRYIHQTNYSSGLCMA